MKLESKIFVAGHKGLVGSAIYNELRTQGYHNLVTRSHEQLDLINQADTRAFFEAEKPEYVFLAAARVGGIMANSVYRADFIYHNIQIQNNIIHSAWKYGVKKLLFLGSSCIYPKNSPQPMKEEYLLSDELEYTNEPYAIAKIAGMKMCEAYNLQYGTNFISVMPTNLYGPNDNYNLIGSHVLPALVRKIHLAKCLMTHNIKAIRHDLKIRPVEGISVSLSDDALVKKLEIFGLFRKKETVQLQLWGTGTPLREFLHSSDLARACVFLMEKVDFNDVIQERGLKEVRNTHINIGVGHDLPVSELAVLIKKTIGFRGEILWDSSKPDGTPRKLMDVSRLNNLGFKAAVALRDGIDAVYKDYCQY